MYKCSGHMDSGSILKAWWSQVETLLGEVLATNIDGLNSPKAGNYQIEASISNVLYAPKRDEEGK